MYLLRVSAYAQRALWDMIDVVGVRFADLGAGDFPRVGFDARDGRTGSVAAGHLGGRAVDGGGRTGFL